MTAILRAIDETSDIRLDKPILLVGRNPDCDVVLNSKKVSRRHCVLAQVARRLVVRDLGSTNGVRVNGEQRDQADLSDGDELTIANLNYRYDLDEGGEATIGDSQRRSRRVTDSQIERASGPVLLDEESSEPDIPPDVPPVVWEAAEGEPASAGWLNVPDQVALSPVSSEHDFPKRRLDDTSKRPK